MSDLKTRINADVITAMKSGDKPRVGLLRMLTAELKQREVVDSIVLTDAVVMASIEKMIKQRRDSESQFRKGDRAELADKEAAEIKILMGYLPQQLSIDEIKALVAQGMSETGAQGAKDMGKVMAWVKPKVAGRADMGQISALIKAQLG